MAAATNNTLLLSLKVLTKAEIQNMTKFLNIKAGKRNQKLLLHKITDQPSGQQTGSTQTLPKQVLKIPRIFPL